jgi:hypothetical protein
MKKVNFFWLVAVGLLVVATGAATAQDAHQNPGTSQSNPDNSDQHGSAVIQLAGCLERGDGAGEYALFGPTAESWELKSESVDLSAHLYQIVVVTAVKSGDSDAALTVLDLKMDSSSCGSW